MAVNRIVLPVDGSATAEAAARFAEDIARSEGEVVMVLGVVVPIPQASDEAESVTAAIRAFMTEQVATEAGRIRAAGIPAEEIVVEADSPHEGILRVTEDREADVIVMGTHGRTGLVRAVIGSVADKVVRHSSVPVVLVPLKSED
jgi:nucleotide-binding universal stress UspA family protein